MSLESDTKKALTDFVKRLDSPMPLICNVTSIDLTTLTCYCEPVNGNADITDVRLMAQKSKGFLIIPKLNSVVCVTFIDDSNAYVSMFSEIDEIQLNGENFDGLVKVADLTSKLNALENKVNDLITACASQVVTLAPAGTFPLAGFFSGVTLLTPTTQVDIENVKVKHGNGL